MMIGSGVLFSQDILDQIFSIPFPNSNMGNDVSVWGGTNNRILSVASVYKGLTKNEGNIPNVDWEAFWKIEMPKRARNVIWILHYNGLKTKQLLAQRNICSSKCDDCIGMEESMIHTL